MAYETIETPKGSYIGWGSREGQFVEGVVTDYDPVGGTDFGNKECPLLEVELVKRAASFNKDGERTDYDPGELVSLTCGQANLKKAIRKGAPRVGNMIRIELTGKERTPNGTVKIFTVQIDRSTNNSNGGSSASSSFGGGSAPANDPWANTPPPPDDEPPF